MQELAVKLLIQIIWNILSRVFSLEFRARLLSLMMAVIDLELPGSAKFDLLREFGKQSLENITPIMSATLSIFITTAFGMVQANGQAWVEKQVGGPVDVESELTKISQLHEKG